VSARSLALRRVLRQLGTPGVAGIGVLIACAAMFYSAQRPLEARIESLRTELAQAEAGAGARGAPRLAPQDGLAEFYRFFATGQDAEAWLARLFGLARAHGLELPQGAYRYNRLSGERLARYEVTLPVKGQYPQIRRFIAAALNEIPVASLDRVAFERKRAAEAQVEASIRFTLFLDEPRS
jgi:hypothetical protein